MTGILRLDYQVEWFAVFSKTDRFDFCSSYGGKLIGILISLSVSEVQSTLITVAITKVSNLPVCDFGDTEEFWINNYSEF